MKRLILAALLATSGAIQAEEQTELQRLSYCYGVFSSAYELGKMTETYDLAVSSKKYADANMAIITDGVGDEETKNELMEYVVKGSAASSSQIMSKNVTDLVFAIEMCKLDTKKALRARMNRVGT